MSWWWGNVPLAASIPGSWTVENEHEHEGMRVAARTVEVVANGEAMMSGEARMKTGGGGIP